MTTAGGDQSILDRCPVVPVIVLSDPRDAKHLGEALLAGGITVAEVTLRTPAGIEGISQMALVPGLRVGAGTVVNPEQVRRVVDAGAQFVVSPGLSAEVIEEAHRYRVPALPGVATASELMTATRLSCREVKFFPAGSLGGPSAITALAAPFPTVSFMPSGGVTVDNMDDYLALPAVPAVGGSWMVAPDLVSGRRWDEVTRRAREAMARAVP